MFTFLSSILTGHTIHYSYEPRRGEFDATLAKNIKKHNEIVMDPNVSYVSEEIIGLRMVGHLAIARLEANVKRGLYGSETKFPYDIYCDFQSREGNLKFYRKDNENNLQQVYPCQGVFLYYPEETLYVESNVGTVLEYVGIRTTPHKWYRWHAEYIRDITTKPRVWNSNWWRDDICASQMSHFTVVRR